MPEWGQGGFSARAVGELLPWRRIQEHGGATFESLIKFLGNMGHHG